MENLEITEMLDNGKSIFQPEPDTYFSNGSQKEISAFITKLLSNDKTSLNNNIKRNKNENKKINKTE